MAEHSISICGLPGSGKTTFLAALWHLVSSHDDISTFLKFESLSKGDYSHLNAIASRWCSAISQERTETGSDRIVSINLRTNDNISVKLLFPDLSGESFKRMWEIRECDKTMVDTLSNGSSLLMFIHADNINTPQWIVDNISVSNDLELELDDKDETPWSPEHTPTQVQLVDILQLLCRSPFKKKHCKLVIMLSAWDKVENLGRSPLAFLRENLPLLEQYLRSGGEGWQWRVYGLSAQGGDYELAAEILRDQDIPSRRIKLVHDQNISHDLTEPLKWLIEE